MYRGEGGNEKTIKQVHSNRDTILIGFVPTRLSIKGGCVNPKGKVINTEKQGVFFFSKREESRTGKRRRSPPGLKRGSEEGRGLE